MPETYQITMQMHRSLFKKIVTSSQSQIANSCLSEYTSPSETREMGISPAKMDFVN